MKKTNSMKKSSVKSFFALALIIATNMAFDCERHVPFPEGESNYCSNDLSWLKDKVEPINSETEVVRYKYKGETVYLINTCAGCADSMDEVYNCDGQLICQLGGIAGLNTCPDFYDTATEKEVVWKNY
jgi:hypothetical protein